MKYIKYFLLAVCFSSPFPVLANGIAKAGYVAIVNTVDYSVMTCFFSVVKNTAVSTGRCSINFIPGNAPTLTKDTIYFTGQASDGSGKTFYCKLSEGQPKYDFAKTLMFSAGEYINFTVYRLATDQICNNFYMGASSENGSPY